jgi:hypothetical protein
MSGSRKYVISGMIVGVFVSIPLVFVFALAIIVATSIFSSLGRMDPFLLYLIATPIPSMWACQLIYMLLQRIFDRQESLKGAVIFAIGGIVGSLAGLLIILATIYDYANSIVLIPIIGAAIGGATCAVDNKLNAKWIAMSEWQ